MRIVVFGTGECGKRVLAALRRGVEVVAASDNSEKMWGQRVSNVLIVRPAEIPALAYDYIVVCSSWAADIARSLVTLGIAPESIVSCYALDDDDARRQRELSILNELVDVAAVELPGVSRRRTASRGNQASGLGRLVSACRRLLTDCRDPRWWYHWFCKLPISRRIALFDSYWGGGYSCNPRAMSEYLASVDDGPRWKIVWGLTEPSATAVPPSVVKVKRLGIAYHYYAARAGLLVTNVNFPDHVVKRPGTLHLQTMHGTPIKTLGLDAPGEVTTEKARTALLKRCDRWDYLTAPGQYTADVARRAYRFTGTVLPFGYPRNDYLFSGNTGHEVHRLRRALGIPASRKVLLFAPTWRPSGDDTVAQTVQEVLTCFAGNPLLSQEYVLLLRFHHAMSPSRVLPPGAATGHVIDVSTYPDNRELMLVADALITDYSSIVFDYALLERPIVLCCLDYQRYTRETRGVYMDLLAESPWPVYQTATEMNERLPIDLQAPVSLTAHRRFVARFGEWERGDACKRIYEEVLMPWRTSRRTVFRQVECERSR